jgi:hypothetical protein
MRRWLLAVAVLLCGALGVSNADYIIIKYNLAPTDKAEKSKTGQGGGEAVPGGGGARGPFGGGLGGPMRPGMGGGSGSGSGSGSRPPGQPGQGFPPGSGGYGPGSSGGSGGSMPPGSGSYGPGSGMYGPGSGMYGPGSQGGAGDEDEVEIEPRYVIAVIEVRNQLPSDRYFQALEQIGRAYPIKHKWGTTHLKKAENMTFLRMEQGKQPWPSAVKSFETEWNKAHPRGEKPSPGQLTELAELALSRGLMTWFHRVMEEFIQNYPKEPAAIGYQKIKAELERPALNNPDVGSWRSRLAMDEYKEQSPDKGHYTLLHNLTNGESDDVQAHLKRLETAFQSFYYWFAVKGKADAVKVPKQRLLAIMVAQGEKDRFPQLRRIFGDKPLVVDGFYARRDNLLVLASERQDSLYQELRTYAETAFKGKDPVRLLNGRDPDNDAQTLALLMKALQEDGEEATASYEGPRQLLAASGLLPRTVEVPQWIQFGMGSFFETPNGSPYPTLGKPSASLLENHNYAYTYKTWAKGKKLEEPKVALEKVITDTYFDLARDGKDPAALLKARTMAWSLTYFLAQEKLGGLLEYYRQLSLLPRDLKFDEQSLQLVFARSFGLTDSQNKVDPARFNAFAGEWERYMKNLRVDVIDVIKLVRTAKPKPAAPGRGGPGGGGGTGSGGT